MNPEIIQCSQNKKALAFSKCLIFFQLFVLEFFTGEISNFAKLFFNTQ
jgi:hypothetical protein